MKIKISESQIVNACLQLLRMKGIFAWRNNTGAAIREYQGRKRFFRFGEPGSPDIIGILKDGTFLGIECKTMTGKLSERQRAFGRVIQSFGGTYFVIHSAEELNNAFHNSRLSNMM